VPKARESRCQIEVLKAPRGAVCSECPPPTGRGVMWEGCSPPHDGGIWEGAVPLPGKFGCTKSAEEVGVGGLSPTQVMGSGDGAVPLPRKFLAFLYQNGEFSCILDTAIIYNLDACFTRIGTCGIDIYWRLNLETIITPFGKLISQSHMIIFMKQEKNFKQFTQSNAMNELSLLQGIFQDSDHGGM